MARLLSKSVVLPLCCLMWLSLLLIFPVSNHYPRLSGSWVPPSCFLGGGFPGAELSQQAVTLEEEF